MSKSRQLTYTMHKVSCLIDKIAERALHGKFDLSFSQLRMLIAIYKRGETSQREIAEFWEVTEAAVSRQMENLINKKLVASKQNKENRREHILSLTTEGEAQVKEGKGLIDSEYDKLYSTLSTEEREVMTTALNKLLNRLCGDENFDCSKKD